jgi:hypothetical protein
MNQSSEPKVKPTPSDNAFLDWYREWLRWSHLPEAERAATPEPVAPSRRAIVAARAQETVCSSRPQATEVLR